MIFRVGKGDRTCDILRVVAAYTICETDLAVSWDRRKKEPIALPRSLLNCSVESEEELCARLGSTATKQLRLLANPSKQLTAAAAAASTLGRGCQGQQGCRSSKHPSSL